MKRDRILRRYRIERIPGGYLFAIYAEVCGTVFMVRRFIDSSYGLLLFRLERKHMVRQLELAIGRYAMRGGR